MTLLEDYENLLKRHERELMDLGDRFRSELVAPICRKYKLTWTSGMGTFNFKRKSERDDYNAPTWSDVKDLDLDPPHGYRKLSPAARDALRPALILLNAETGAQGWTNVGHLVSDVE